MSNALAIIFPNLGLGGVQRRMVDISNFVTSSKKYPHTQVALIIKERGAFNFCTQLKKTDKIKVLVSSDHFVMRKINNIFFLLFVHYQLFFKIKPSQLLIFFHYSLPTVLLYKILFPKTSITLSQDNILSLYNKKPHVNLQYAPFLIRFLYSFVDHVIVQTHTARRDLINTYSIPENKIHVIPNWCPDKSPKKIHAIKDRTYDLIYAGRFAPQKRLELCIELCTYIVRHNPNFKALFLGEGSEETAMRRLIRINSLENNIELKRPSHNQKKYLLDSKHLALTSEFEGHPMILTEAMSMGVIPLVLNYPGCTDYLLPDIDSLVEKSVPLLAKKFLAVHQNKKELKFLSKNAIYSALDRFNFEVLMTETLELIFN